MLVRGWGGEGGREIWGMVGDFSRRIHGAELGARSELPTYCCRARTEDLGLIIIIIIGIKRRGCTRLGEMELAGGRGRGEAQLFPRNGLRLGNSDFPTWRGRVSSRILLPQLPFISFPRPPDFYLFFFFPGASSSSPQPLPHLSPSHLSTPSRSLIFIYLYF